MGSNLAIIDERKVLGKEFRMYGTFDEPLFLAQDVSMWIEHNNITLMMRMIEDNEKLTYTIHNSGQGREMWFITEDGLYEVLMQSRKPIAKQFKKEVKEILKSVRKHGTYMTPEVIEKTLADPDFIIQLATQLKTERQQRLLAEQTIEEQKPKVLFAQAVETSKDSVLIGELAKILKQNGVEIGQNRLFAWLRDEGYLCNKGEYRNIPSQRSMEAKLFEIKKTVIHNYDGSTRVVATSKVTPKGQIYLVNKFLSQDRVVQ